MRHDAAEVEPDRPPSSGERLHPVDMAVRFVAAQVGGSARILTLHHRRDDGYCAGCTTMLTRWPCTAAAIAKASLDRPATGGCSSA